MQAPKKRDELVDEDAVRKNQKYDPDNLSIRAFRLDGTPSNGSEGSTENSSAGFSSPSRQTPMGEIRSQFSAFSQQIMQVSIPQNGLLRC